MQQLSNYLITSVIYAQSCFGINAHLNGNKTHERHAAGWEIATPYVDEHEDKGASKDAKVEERQQAGNLAAEQCLSNLKSRTGRHMYGMHQCAIWQKQQVALNMHATDVRLLASNAPLEGHRGGYGIRPASSTTAGKG